MLFPLASLPDFLVHVGWFLVKAVGLAGVALAGFWLARKGLDRILGFAARRTRLRWDDFLVETGVFRRLAHLVPALILHLGGQAVFYQGDEAWVRTALQMAVNLYLIFIALFVLDGILNTVARIFQATALGRKVPIKGFIQAIKLIAILVGIIFAVAILFKKSPVFILSGLGALTAVLMLIFRDAILGFVAGIQLSVNNMIRVGDWIQMDRHGADGDVIDISLTTVKVRNWDKTITAIPAYDLIASSFVNWRGMQDANGRRIKRAIPIDMRTVTFVDEAMRDRFSRFQLLRPYLEDRVAEIEDWNASRRVDHSEPINGRRLTNLGCFRAYCVAYLRGHSRIRQDMTFLVRQLPPTADGLPLEIYVFTATVVWGEYEDIQSDIFDHLLAVVPLFGLSVFQNPAGRDLEKLVASGGR